MTTKSVTANPNSIDRRHDLDALRAFAMLLGIGLHAGMSFLAVHSASWPVTDVNGNGAFNLVFSAIHGFRMPLFFLLSGFFTCMLWRKRGLRQLLLHRTKRIALPLLIGLFTIIPAVWAVSIWASLLPPASSIADSNTSETATEQVASGLPASIWEAAAVSEAAEFQQWIEQDTETDKEFDPNAVEPTSGLGLLTIAAMHGNESTTQWLIGQGANVNARARDGGTALHLAVLLGQPETAKKLITSGASLNLRNSYGATSLDHLQVDMALTRSVCDLVQVQQTDEQIIDGRTEISEWLDANPEIKMAASQVPVEDAGMEQLYGLVMLLCMFPVFHHLWFLWFLCWLVAGFALYAYAAQRFHWQGPSPWLIVSPIRYVWLIVLTLVPASFMGLIFPVFGPDTSTGLVPLPHLLIYYAIFFGFGVWYFDADDQKGQVGKYWWITLPVALLIVFPLGYEFTLGEFGFGQQLLPAEYHRPAAVVLQTLYVWLMTFGMIGLARATFHGENAWMRYLSDSSYWLYVAHLPLIILLQALMRNWSLPAFAKIFMICFVSCSLLLLSYEWFIRYSPIGTMLNGKRTRVKRDNTAAQLATE